MLLRAWRRARFVLHAPLPPEELLRGLREHVAPGWAFATRLPVVGHVSTRFLWLRMRGNIFSRNSMQPHLFARLADAPGGTRLECRFVLHPIVLAFFAMWLALLITLLGRVVVTFAKGAGESDMAWVVPVALLGGAAAVVGIAAVGNHFARHDRENLLAFLKETVGAVPN